MQAPNRKKSPNLLRALMAMFVIGGMAQERAESKVYHLGIMGGGNGEYHPRKHTVMNYRTQQRNALKRRRAK
jgi:hypothetical protein